MVISTCLQNHTSHSCAHAFITHIHVFYSQYLHIQPQLSRSRFGSRKAALPFAHSHLPPLLSLYLSHSVALSLALALYAMLYFCCLCCLGTLFLSVFLLRFHIVQREASSCRFFLFSFLSCGLPLFLLLSLSRIQTLSLSHSLSLGPYFLCSSLWLRGTGT